MPVAGRPSRSRVMRPATASGAGRDIVSNRRATSGRRAGAGSAAGAGTRAPRARGGTEDAGAGLARRRLDDGGLGLWLRKPARRLSQRAARSPRIAAQIVSGIGFLGAGTILLRRQFARGLTTAATIWLVAGLGIACGGGALPGAPVGPRPSLPFVGMVPAGRPGRVSPPTNPAGPRPGGAP